MTHITERLMPSPVGSGIDCGEHCARDLTLARVAVVAQVDKIRRGGHRAKCTNEDLP